MNCPSCGHDQWKSASLVHKEGSSSLSSKSVGIGVSLDGSVGAGGASTSGVQQTELSRMAAPPATFVNTTRCLLGVLVTGVLGFVSSTWWWLTGICAIGVVLFYRSETKQDDILSHRYKNTRMCTRCGMFYLAKDGLRTKSSARH